MPDLLERLRTALSDRYVVESEIGRGGMATVFLAEDLKHRRKVAIKVLHPELGAAVGGERFAHEIEIVGGLTHPHILALHDSGEADGLLFYVMPYVEGESLRQRLDREKQLPLDVAIRIAQEVAGALDHAHGKGVVHRDIKPANILLEGGHAVVADFGVARAVSQAGGERVTATGMAVGTPAYMSPEQASGEEVDERSDIYALGCVLYEMLAGEPPLTGATPQSTAAKRLRDRPTPLGAIRNTVPANLQSLVEGILATSPVDRPATAGQLAEQLEEVRRSPEGAARRSPRPRWLVPVIGLAAILASALLWMLVVNRSTIGPDLGVRSIAIVPFSITTGAEGDESLGFDLAELLSIKLAQREAVRVVAAEHLGSLIRHQGLEQSDRAPEELALEAAAAAGARTMIDASVAGTDSSFRLAARLIDVSDGTIISAAQVQGADLFALVDEVSARILSRLLDETISPEHLTPVAQLTTGSLDAYREYQAGRLAQHRVQLGAAEQHYQRAIQLDSTFALAWLRLGTRQLTRSDYELAASSLERAERFSSDALERDRLMIRAVLAQVSRQWDESIDHLEELLARYPYDQEARLHLGLTYETLDRIEESQRVLEEVLALDPFHPGAVNLLAYQAARAGDEARADSLSLRFIEVEPDQWNPYDSRADILRMFGRSEEALDMDRETIRRNPGYPTPYGRLGRSFLEDDDPEVARAALEPFGNTPEGAVYVQLFETDTYIAEGRYLDALASNRIAAGRAMGLGRDHFLAQGWDLLPLILGETGIHAVATGEYEQAEAAFRELDRIDGLNPSALFGILATYGMQDRFDDMSQVRDVAAAALDSGPELARRRAQSLLHFANGLIAWYRDGDFEETVRLFDEGKAAGGIRGYMLTPSMGVQGEQVLALIEVGRALDALALTDAMEEAAVDAGWYRLLAHTAWYLRGRAYEALGESEQALVSYQQLLDVAGDRVGEIVLFRDTPERVARLKGEG